MRINPILRNEMKTDSRRFRFYLLLMLYVALLSIPVLFFYRVIVREYRIDAEGFSSMYIFLACMQAIVLMFIVPALTSNTITGEREKQTLDILLTTQMTPRSIIWGKLLAAVSKVILLIICTMPVYAVVLFLGGIRMSHILGINLYLIMTTLFIGSMCVWISTMVKTSKFANVTAYFLELGLIIGYPAGILIWASLSEVLYQSNHAEEIIMHILCISPAVGYGHLIGNQLMGGNLMTNLFGVSGMNMIMPGWLLSVVVEVVLTIVFLELAIRRLNPLRRSFKDKFKSKKAKKGLVEESGI